LTSTRRREVLGAAALAFLGVGVRLAFVAAFPTEPLSDFRGIVLFGLRLRDEGFAVPGWHWVQFNPGLPLILSGLFRIFPHGVTQTAREATAVVTGLMPLLPFCIWRGIVAFRWRFAAGIVLALWPGQVMFSGAVAQENWAMLPAVALVCLAVRRLRTPGGGSFAVAAGFLYALAAAFRQEMLVAMLVPAAAAAGLPGARAGRAGRTLRLAAAALVPLLGLAAQRRAATGRFAVTTEHGGLGVLGTLVPGSAGAGWVDPVLYVAAVEPRLLTDPVALRRSTWRLSWDEARRRWRFQAFRAAASAVRLSVESEAQNLMWTLDAPGAQPPATAVTAAAVARAARPLLRVELSLISGFFWASVLLALRRRDPAVLAASAAALAEMFVQVAFSPLGRLMVPVIALELLVICLAAADLAASGRRNEKILISSVGLAIAATLFVASAPLQGLAVRKDESPPRVAHFPLAIAGARGVYADCVVEAGRLTVIAGDRARVGAGPAAVSSTSPAAGSRVACRLPGLPSEAALFVDLEGERWVRISADGRSIPCPPGPAPAPSWRRLPVTAAGEPAPREIVFEGDGEGRELGFGLVSRSPGARPLPRDLALP
jgi:hypothetical protein